MRKTIALLAATATLSIAAPALAQLGGTVGNATGSIGSTTGTAVGATAGTTLDTGKAVDQTLDRAGTAVHQADGTVQQQVDRTAMRAVASGDLQTGLKVTDSEGKSIGTVQSVSGDTAVIADGSKVYNVPVSDLYAKGSGKVKKVSTLVPRASLDTQAKAAADTGG